VAIFALIRSIEPEPDGTLRIRGSAALEGDIDRGDLRRTIEVYATDGPLREMSSQTAAGLVTSLFADDDRVTISAHVVDPGVIKKIQRGVLKMFAVGSRFVRLVDAPHDTGLNLWKGAFEGV
jgi:hypothetical protein